MGLHIVIDGEQLTLEDVWAAAHAAPGALEVVLSPEAEAKVARARAAVEQFVAEGRIVYGITTGFGAFKDRFIQPEEVRQLQRNIVMSHAVRVGAPLETAAVRALMIIRANTLAKGHSGIRGETLSLLLRMLERGVHPVVPRQGSMAGASASVARLLLLLLADTAFCSRPAARLERVWAAGGPRGDG